MSARVRKWFRVTFNVCTDLVELDPNVVAAHVVDEWDGRVLGTKHTVFEDSTLPEVTPLPTRDR